MTETEKQLMLLRALTSTTGIIHEAQITLIKNWGAVAFAFVGTNWEAQIFICDGEECKHTSCGDRTVTYHLTTKKKAPKDLPQYVAALDRSIHWLLGDDWRLVVKANKKQIYRGAAKKSKKADTISSQDGKEKREAAG